MDLNKSRAGVENKFFELCLKVAAEQGLKIYDLEFLASQHLLRIYIMNEQTRTCTLEDCVRMDHAMTPFVEGETWMPPELTLEVSSPGVYRVLKNLDHFQMAVGELIKLEFVDKLDAKIRPALPKGAQGQKKLRATLKSVDTEGLILEASGKELEFKFSEIKKANLDPEIGKNMRV